MPIYTVRVKEIWMRLIDVAADSPQDAIRKVQADDEVGEEGDMEYLETLPVSEWSVYTPEPKEENAPQPPFERR